MSSTNGHGPKRAILYARVSTRAQAEEDHYSLPQQLAALREYASREGYEVPEGHEITDAGYSGATLERPGLDHVRDLVAAGEVSVVLAQDRDRFAREPALLWLLEQELAVHGTTLRALNNRGDDSPEGVLTDGILDQLAKYERAKTAERTRRGKLQRAREGKVLPGAGAPYGFSNNNDRTNYIVNEREMTIVRRVFRALGAEGKSISFTARELESDGVPARSGGPHWHKVGLRAMVLNDLYRAHDHAELAALTSEGVLLRPVLERLDPAERYGVWWFNRERVAMASGGTKKRTHRPKPRAEWIAVPTPDPGIPREWVDAAREAIKDNVRSASAGRRFWELSGGVAYCECGSRMGTHSMRRKGGFTHYYVCGRKRNGKRECLHYRYHRAQSLEERVRRFVLGVLSDPETMRRSAQEQLERERAAFRDPEGQISRLSEVLASLDSRRSRYQEMFAADAMTLPELKAKLASLDAERSAAEDELARLGGIKEEFDRLERLAEEIPEFLADLPDLIEGTTDYVQEYETIPAERTAENPLGIYTLAPDRLRKRKPEELEEIRSERERKRAERFRWAYQELGLKVVVSKDGELELSGTFGRYGPTPTSSWLAT